MHIYMGEDNYIRNYGVSSQEKHKLWIPSIFGTAEKSIETTNPKQLYEFFIERSKCATKLGVLEVFFTFDEASGRNKKTYGEDKIVATKSSTGELWVNDEMFEPLLKAYGSNTLCGEVAEQYMLDVIFESEVKQDCLFANPRLLPINLNTKFKPNCKFFLLWNVISVQDSDIQRIYDGVGEDFLFENIYSKRLEILGGKKLKNALGVCSAALEYIRTYHTNKLYECFQRLSAIRDGNDVKYLTDYLRLSRSHLPDNARKMALWNEAEIVYFEFLCNIVEKTKLSIQRIVSYAWAQELYFRKMFENSSSERFSELSLIALPNSVMQTWSDYLDMMDAMGAKLDVTPYNIFEEHYYLANTKNYIGNEEIAESFNKAVIEYSTLEHDFKDDKNKKFRKYKIIAPKSIEEMISEGLEMHNCMAFYIDKVIDGHIVLFIRLAEEENVPYMAFEVDYNLNFIQIKEKYDKDVEDEEIMELLQHWKKQKGKQL